MVQNGLSFFIYQLNNITTRITFLLLGESF